MSTTEDNNKITLHQRAPLERFPELSFEPKPLYPPRLWMNSYILLAIAANFFCLFMKTHGSDMNFWYNWTTHLAEKGYQGFSGNYPPIYLHWLYFSGKFLHFVGLPVDAGVQLKFMAQLPIVASHLVLTGVVFSLLARHQAPPTLLHVIMLLTALNPALLFDGPIWGQVDIFPTIFIVTALYLLAVDRYRFLALPLFTLALLTKFQMICFAPVFAIIFFRNLKDTVIGSALSLAVIGIVLLPLALTESVWKIIDQAYIQTLGEYPYTTLNAGNFWMLLTDNQWPDSYILFGFEAGTWAGTLFTAKHFGILLFFLVTLTVFISGLWHLFKRTDKTPSAAAERLTFYALMCSTGFFVLLPGMHERYIIPAVIIALVYAAFRPRRLIYAAVLAIVGLLNMTQVHPITHSTIWAGLSWIVVILFAFLLLDLSKVTDKCQPLFKKLTGIIQQPYIPTVAFCVATITMLGIFLHIYRTHTVELEANQILLSDLRHISVSQGFGRLHINRNVSNTVLSANNIKYAYGLGTHAQSTIVYDLPPGSMRFQFIAGIDDMAPQGEVSFAVHGDGRRLWQSDPVYGSRNNPVIGDISVEGVSRLTLIVNSRGPTNQDHANWINPIITLESPQESE